MASDALPGCIHTINYADASAPIGIFPRLDQPYPTTAKLLLEFTELSVGCPSDVKCERDVLKRVLTLFDVVTLQIPK